MKVLFKLYDLLAGAPLVARPAAGGVVVGAAPLELHGDPPLAAALLDGHGPIQTCKRGLTMLSILRERQFGYQRSIKHLISVDLCRKQCQVKATW